MGLAAAVFRIMIVNLTDRAVVVCDGRVPGGSGVFGWAAVVTLLGRSSVGPGQRHFSTAIRNLAIEILYIRQRRVLNVSKRCAHVANVSMAFYAFQDAVEVGLRGSIVMRSLALDNLALNQAVL